MNTARLLVCAVVQVVMPLLPMPRRAQRGLNRGRVVTEVRRQGQINLHRDYEDGSIHDQSQEHRVNRALRRGAAAGCAAAFITRARHL